MATTQYIGSRYVPLFAEPTEWTSARTYEPLTIVTYKGDSYTSRQYVPVGIELTDEHYWVCTGNYNAQIEQYRTETKANTKAISDEVKRAKGVESSIRENIDTINDNLTENINRVDDKADDNAKAIAANKARIDGLFTMPAEIVMAEPVARVECTDARNFQGGCVVPDKDLYIIGFGDGTIEAYCTRNGMKTGGTVTTAAGNHNNSVNYNGTDTIIVSGGNADGFWTMPITENGLGTPTHHTTRSLIPTADRNIAGIGWYDDDTYWFHYNYTDLYTIPVSGGTPTKLCDIPWHGFTDNYVWQDMDYDRVHKLFYLATSTFVTVFTSDGHVVSQTKLHPSYNGCSSYETESFGYNTKDGCFYFAANSAPVICAAGEKHVSTIFKTQANGTGTDYFISNLSNTLGETRVLIGVDYNKGLTIWNNTVQNVLNLKYAQDAWCLMLENQLNAANFEIDVYTASKDFGVITGGVPGMRVWFDPTAQCYGIYQQGGFVSYALGNTYVSKADWVEPKGLINAPIPSTIKIEYQITTNQYLINANNNVVYVKTGTTMNEEHMTNCIKYEY